MKIKLALKIKRLYAYGTVPFLKVNRCVNICVYFRCSYPFKVKDGAEIVVINIKVNGINIHLKAIGIEARQA